MRTTTLVVGLSLACALARLDAQEKPLPKNEVRVQIPGCAYNRAFISALQRVLPSVRGRDNDRERTD